MKMICDFKVTLEKFELNNQFAAFKAYGLFVLNYVF